MRELHRQDIPVRSVDKLEVHLAPPVNESQFATAWHSLLRHWSLIATTALASLVVAVFYLALAQPQYMASGLLFIDTKSNSSIRSSTPTLTDANVESANIDSQVELLKSERIMRRVVEAENMADDPALAPGALQKVIATVVGTLAFWREPRPPSGDNPKVIAAARALQKLTSAKRNGLTYTVEIASEMPDPDQAARVTNAYAQAFIDDQMRLREETSRRMSSLLQARTDELQAQAQKAERAVEQLKFSGSLDGENSASTRVTLKNLESAAQAYRLLHDKFLERYAETWQQQFLSLPDAQIASAAYPPQSKSSPKALIVLASALFIGVALGLIRVILRDRRVIGLQL